MSGSTTGFTPEQFEQFKVVIRALGKRQGSFDAIDATLAIVRAHLAENGQLSSLGKLRDIIGVLRKMENLGLIKRLVSENGGSRLWLWVEEEAGTRDLPPAA